MWLIMLAFKVEHTCHLSRPWKDVVKEWPSQLRHEPGLARYFPADKTHLISYERSCTQGQQTTAKHIEGRLFFMLAYVYAFAYLFSPNFMLELYVGKPFCLPRCTFHCIKPQQKQSLFHAILARAYATMERPRGSYGATASLGGSMVPSEAVPPIPTPTRDPSKRGTASLRRSNNANQLGFEAIAARDLPEIMTTWKG